MNHIFSKLIYLVIIIFISGCSVSGYQSYYKEYPQSKELYSDKRAVFLKEGEQPQVFYSANLKADIDKAMAKLYIPLGYSSFNGQLANESEIIEQAKKLKAVLAIYTKKYTNTQNVSGAYVMPQTNYVSGNVYGTGGYATYQGTQTTNTVVPYSINQTRFDQEAVFFVKRLDKPRFGIYFVDLTREQRIEAGTTGVLALWFYEDTPAFKSNLLEGDIIVQVDDEKVRDTQHLITFLTNYNKDKKSTIIKVLRDKAEKEITLTLD